MTEPVNVLLNTPMTLSQIVEAVLAKHGCEEAVVSFNFADGLSVDVYRNDGDFDEVTETAAKELWRFLRQASFDSQSDNT